MPRFLAWIGHWEILLVLLVVFLLFGTRLPKVARSLGQGIREFKGGIKGLKDEVDRAGDPEDETKGDPEDEEKQG